MHELSVAVNKAHVVPLLQSREQRKIEAIEKTFEKIEQRQKSGKRSSSTAMNDVEPDTTNPVSVLQ